MTPEPGARARILAAARDLFQRRGYHGAGLAEILAQAQAPKSSLYHHFPAGKDELAAAAVDGIAADVTGWIAARAGVGRGGVEIVTALAGMCASRMAAEDFAWSPLISALGGQTDGESPRLAAALSRAYGDWRSQLAAAFRKEGLSDADAASAAQLSLLALEGAILLCRGARNADPLALVGPLLARFVHAPR